VSERRPLLILLSATAFLFAADYWEKKPYTKWDDQEIARLLIDSPWAKEVIIKLPRDYVPAPPAAPPPASLSGVTGQTSVAASSGAGPLGYSVGKKTQSLPPGATVRVRWESAEPMRQAIARTLYSAGSNKALDLVLNHPPGYVIVIDNIPPYLESARFGSLQADLMASATLRPGKHNAIHPSSVVVSANSGGLVVKMLFPSDEPIRFEDREVVLEAQAGISGIRCVFQLNQMLFQGKLAL
jgi:hypothetical protein